MLMVYTGSIPVTSLLKSRSDIIFITLVPWHCSSDTTNLLHNHYSGDE